MSSRAKPNPKRGLRRKNTTHARSRRNPRGPIYGEVDGDASWDATDGSLLKLATQLFDRQIWCWGKDIEYAGGNLLLKFGFKRTAAPRCSGAASIYRLNFGTEARLILRGFGVFVGDDRYGGIFVGRDRFVPKMTPAADLIKPAWQMDDLPKLTLPRESSSLASSTSLLASLTKFISDYEAWIRRRVGIAYRWTTLDEWRSLKRRIIESEFVEPGWQRIGKALDAALASQRHALAFDAGGQGR
jgi:hypothetical protein